MKRRGRDFIGEGLWLLVLQLFFNFLEVFLDGICFAILKDGFDAGSKRRKAQKRNRKCIGMPKRQMNNREGERMSRHHKNYENDKIDENDKNKENETAASLSRRTSLNWKSIRRFVLINIGLLIMAFGLHVFIVPTNLAIGGVTGLGLVIKAYFPSLNLGVLMLGFNIILFVMAFLFIGRDFGGYTIYASLALSGMIGVFERMLPVAAPVTEDLMLNLLFGTLIPAVGMAIVFYQNASTGGTDIVAKIINKYTNIEIGKALFLSDALVTVAAAFTFNLTVGMFAFLGILLNGTVIDKVIAGFETKVHTQIITAEVEKVSDFIHSHLSRGATLLTATGGYTGAGKKVIVTVLEPREYIRLRQFVRSVDPKAFIIMSYVNEVLGEGFDY